MKWCSVVLAAVLSRLKGIAYVLLGLLAIPLVSLASFTGSLITTGVIVAFAGVALLAAPPAFAGVITLLLVLSSPVLLLYLYRPFNSKVEDAMHMLSSKLFQAAASSNSNKNLRHEWRQSSSILVPVIFVYVLVAALPQFMDDRGAPDFSRGARNTIKTAYKECAVKIAQGELNPSFSVLQIKHYSILPKDGNCAGDENGELAAISNDNRSHPDFYFLLSEPYTKRCVHSGKTEEFLGCSARVNGRW